MGEREEEVRGGKEKKKEIEKGVQRGKSFWWGLIAFLNLVIGAFNVVWPLPFVIY